jgi:hypothetical protein
MLFKINAFAVKTAGNLLLCFGPRFEACLWSVSHARLVLLIWHLQCSGAVTATCPSHLGAELVDELSERFKDPKTALIEFFFKQSED